MSTTAHPGCQEMLSRISAYFDGDLDETACDAIEQHCHGCPSCASIVEGLRRTVGVCRHAGDLPLPDAVRERARASLRQLLDSSPRDPD